MLVPARLALALSLPALGLAPVQAPPRLDFEGIAREFLAAHGLEAEELSFDALIDGPAFAGVRLGGFDLWIPVASLDDKELASEFETIGRVLIDLQAGWLEWRNGEADEVVAEDWKTLRKWVGGWSASKLRSIDGGPEDLYGQLKANEKVTAAQERLEAHALASQSKSGMRGASGIVLAPRREDFVQVVAVAGLLDPPSRAALWAPEVIGLAGAWVGWTGVVAMEYPAEVLDPERPFLGRSITEREQTELVQHVADRAAAILMRREFARHGTQFFEESLGADLVIGAAGKNTLLAAGWQHEWRRAGAKTRAYSRFVPGGNSSGGVLPKRRAGPGATSVSGTEIGRYRQGGGEDYFKAVLRDGQKLGAKVVSREHPRRRDKTAHFVLTDTVNGGRTTISAPFLGQPAEGKPLPSHEFLDDYEDLFRAYRALFIFWLRHHAAGSEEDSARRFGEVLGALAERDVGTPAEPVFAEVYAVPLSAPDPSEESLEWRFLAWLAKGR